MKISGKWNESTLGDVAQIQTGPFGSQLHENDYVEKGVPIITVEHLGDNRIIKNDIPCVSDSDVLRLKKFLLETGDIVFSRVGSVDRSVLIREDENGWMFSGRCLRVRVQINDITSEYLSYFFAQKNFKQYVRNNAVGATMPSLNSSILRRLKIRYPSTLEQNKTTNILSALDDLIDINRRRIQLLEESARLLFREWFVYLRFPGHEMVKIVDGVPEGWKKEYLSKLVTTQYGYTETASQEEIGPKFLRGTDINKTSYINWASVPYCPNEKLDFRKYSLSRGDILIVRMADPGKVGIVEVEIEAIFASYLVRLKVINKNISSYYLFYSLLDDKYQGFITGSSTGSTRKSASAKLLVDYNLLIPEKEIINSFDEQIVPIRKEINILLQQNQKLAQARDLLLPRLMSGAIEV